MATKKKSLLAAAGNAGGALAIEDVFSTYLYTGNGSTQTITNGIDLAGEGGMVWIKTRNQADFHANWDTERGATNALSSNATNAEYSSSGITSFNADGFTLGSTYNASGDNFASWTFRKAPRFFDVVTYTGNDGSTDLVVNHNLGTTVGTIIVKNTSTASDWYVWHRSLPTYNFSKLNTTDASSTSAAVFKAVTDTSFTLGGFSGVNALGDTFVAYLFAHDPLGPSGDGSDGLIACGSYTGTGSTSQSINLGFEPAWLLIKAAGGNGNWNIVDNMRGIASNGDMKPLYAQSSQSETTVNSIVNLTATGFDLIGSNNDLTFSGRTYIYIAIRRGPMRQPESGTEVFTAVSGTSTNPAYVASHTVDAVILKQTGSSNTSTQNRLIGEGRSLNINSTNAEYAFSGIAFDYQTGAHDSAIPNFFSWMFRRAPGFFDVLAWTGDGSTRTFNHNLGAPPELVIAKERDLSGNWYVGLPDILGTGQMFLNTTNAYPAVNGYIQNPTDTTIYISLRDSGSTYIAYLFATVPGISKVGSYTGNGSSQTINCGFTSGSRFILIKRTDASGDWYVWDTARGIVAANDPHLSLNTTAAEVTTDDSVDPDNSGFIVNQVAATNINVSSASYIFYAIA